MKKIVMGTILALVLFSCTPEPVLREERQAEDPNVTVDFTSFPAHAVWKLTGEEGQGTYKFDTDSARFFSVHIPEGRYTMKWTISVSNPSKLYRANLYGGNAEVQMFWENGTSTGTGWIIKGLYAFTRKHR